MTLIRLISTTRAVGLLDGAGRWFSSRLQSGHAGCCTLHTRSPGQAFERIANLMGIARQVPVRDATIATAESIDFIVQIRILHEVRRVTDIVQVEKKLRNGRPGCTPVFRFDGLPPWMPRAGSA